MKGDSKSIPQGHHGAPYQPAEQHRSIGGPPLIEKPDPKPASIQHVTPVPGDQSIANEYIKNKTNPDPFERRGG